MSLTTVQRYTWAVAIVFLTACTESIGPVSPPGDESLSPAPAAGLASVVCRASVQAGTVLCAPPSLPAVTSGDIIIGGQGVYVQLTSSNVTFAGGLFGFDVTVQNLIPQPLGTTDGTTLDPDGVRAFVHSGPTVKVGTGNIAVANADDSAIFLTSEQPYFQYDHVLAQFETSSAKRWEMTLDPGVDEFEFTVYVSAAVQYANGWIDVTAPAALLEGAAALSSASVRSAVGNAIAGGTLEWSSDNEAVATVDALGNVTAVTPGQSVITVTDGVRSGSLAIGVCPALDVGGVYIANLSTHSATCAAGFATGAEYTYVPINLAPAATMQLSVTGGGIVPVIGPPVPLIAGGIRLDASFDAVLPDVDEHMKRLEDDNRIVLAMGSRRMPPSPRYDRAGGAMPRLIVPGVPAIGDLWPLNVATGCDGARDDRTGRVVAIGSHVIIVADTTNPAGGFTTAQFDSIAAEFDSIANPVATANFGAPTDLDGNSRVVAFYTRAVNELSPPASSFVVNGYFTARDLFSSAPGSCPRSNEGEMFYMLVPDPTGAVNSNVRTVSSVRGGTVATMAHEFQHLINAARRIHIHSASSLETVWLNEGLSHIVEELLFYHTSFGLAPRGNIALADLTTGPNASRRVAAFNTYANQNFGRFRPFLQRPDTTGPFRNNDVLATRGAIWAFLRYAADRRNGNDATLWFNLVNTTSTGTDNLNQALGVDALEWSRDFAAALYADDAVASGAEHQITSWNFRSVYAGLGGFPLLARPLVNNTPLGLTYAAGGATSFLRFGVAADGFANLTAQSGGGAPPPATGQFVLIRTK